MDQGRIKRRRGPYPARGPAVADMCSRFYLIVNFLKVNLQVFQRYVLLPSSGWKNKPRSKKLEERGGMFFRKVSKLLPDYTA
jgi:hypothetical protein